MAKKLILLILIIPIIVMIALFAFTKTVSLLIDTPVSDIKLVGNDTYTILNMDLGHTYSLEYFIEPTTATNKAVSVTTGPNGDEPLAELEFIKSDGKVVIVPKSAGEAIVTVTTHDGGHSKNFTVTVESTKLKSINASIDKTDLFLGEAGKDTATISLSYYPKKPSNTLVNYVSGNTNVATVDEYGVVKAKGVGSTTIKIISEFDESITAEVPVNVKLEAPMYLGATEITQFASPGTIPIYFDERINLTADKVSYKITYADGTEVPDSVMQSNLNINGNTASINYTFTNPAFSGDLIATVKFNYEGGEVTQTCSISILNDVKMFFNKEGAFEASGIQTTFIPFTVLPAESKEDFTYTASASNENVTVRISGTGKLVLESKLAGVTSVTLTATDKLDPTNVKSITCDVVVTPLSMLIAESTGTYGDENKLTVGGYEFSNKENPSALTESKGFSLSYNTGDFPEGAGFGENLVWHSSSAAVSIDKDGKISFNDNTFVGDVTFYASFAYGGIEKKTPAFTVTCVANGINVFSYPELYYATLKRQPIVLMADVVNDFGIINGEYKYTTIDTTYDKTYYTNTGRENEAKIKILLEFKNDVYGNGYVINAHNVTYKLEKDEFNNMKQNTDPEVAPFQGPLDFVKIKEENGSTTSVKAQDNVCFALYEGVTVRNVKLFGCTLESKNGKTDLTHLNYIGTTVEVFGDNVTIAYSRLTNGRTVLRAFGAIKEETDKDGNVTYINDSEKKITVNITNSVLSGAREFIMRLGSNRFYTEAGVASPTLPGDNTDAYTLKSNYHVLTPDKKASYDESYINTFVNVRNSVFESAGIFAIGLDSHFAGSLLHNGESKQSELAKYLVGWKNLAKTSYGVKLTLLGDVKFYNWNETESIDSSTLIEIIGETALDDFNLALDVKDMVDKVAENPSSSSIITTEEKDGKTYTYIHAGIVFFGGGKNYSVVDYEDSSNHALNHYSITLDQAGKGTLNIAAGQHPFYFFIYDSTSQFTHIKQNEIINSGHAYDCINKK